MIKENELRIGNWLLFTGEEETKAVQIGLHDFWEFNVEEKAIEMLDPIPLTPEILEKCGFKQWQDGTYRVSIDEYIVFHIEEDGRYGFWSDSVENESNFTVVSQDNRIKHLHQLQNLYFALTGQELVVKL